MKKTPILLILILVSGLIYAQDNSTHITVFKLFFKDKQIDSVGYKFFQFLSAKEKKTENSGQPLDIRFENECKCVVYSNNDDSIHFRI
jgi:hypothetical protein